MKHSPADDDRDALQKGTRSFFLPGKMMSVHCQRRGKSEMTRDVTARNKSPVEGFFSSRQVQWADWITPATEEV